MRSLAVLIFLLLNTGQYAYGLTPPNASAGGCALLNTTIYCYGGYTSNSNSSSDVYELDLSKELRIQSNDIYSQWAAITVDRAPQPSVNAHFAIAAIPGYRRFVIDGGVSDRGALPTKTQSTLSFEPDNRVWDLVPNMTAATMQSHTMVLGNSSANLLYLWGGYGSRSRAAVYWGATRVLNLNTNAWSFLRSLPPNFGIRLYHSAVLAKDNTTIYYIGGRLATLVSNTTNVSTTELSSNYSLTDPGMSSIYAYNTVSDSWSNRTVGGASMPSSRVLHSTVLLSDGNILLYGGSQLNNTINPVDDYFYVLNTTNTNALTWSTFEISTKEAPGPGPRYGHSAIRVSSTTVFILFGGTTSAPASNEVHILDVSNWAWTRSFAGIGSSPSSAGSPQPTSPPTDSSVSPKGDDNLSGGSIAGIVIGVLAAFALAGAILFFVKRRRRDTSSDKDFAREREAMAVPYDYSGSHHHRRTSTTAQGSAVDEDDFVSPPLTHEQQHHDGGHHGTIHHAAVLPPTTTTSLASDHPHDTYQPEPYNPRFNEMIYTPQLALHSIPPPPRSETPRIDDGEEN